MAPENSSLSPLGKAAAPRDGLRCPRDVKQSRMRQEQGEWYRLGACRTWVRY